MVPYEFLLRAILLFGYMLVDGYNCKGTRSPKTQQKCCVCIQLLKQVVGWTEQVQVYK